MKKLIFARYVNRLFLTSLGIVVVSPCSAGAAQASSSNSAYQPSYAPRPPSEVGASESYRSGNYTPPTYSAGSATPRDARFAISKSAGPNSTTTSGKLDAKVAQLAKNDQRQDQRLRHLEQDVTSLKTGEKFKSPRQDYTSTSNAVHLHTVRAGETLWGIAAKYNTSVNAVRTANRMSSDTVVAGQALAIPVEGAEAGAGASTSVQAYTVRPGSAAACGDRESNPNHSPSQARHAHRKPWRKPGCDRQKIWHSDGGSRGTE